MACIPPDVLYFLLLHISWWMNYFPSDKTNRTDRIHWTDWTLGQTRHLDRQSRQDRWTGEGQLSQQLRYFVVVSQKKTIHPKFSKRVHFVCVITRSRAKQQLHNGYEIVRRGECRYLTDIISGILY